MASLGEAGLRLRRFSSRTIGTSWATHARRLSSFLLGITDEVPYSIFARKNSKLPYWNFSTLPGITCPGAGECLNWCYSFRSWRVPGPFFRQAQNTLLLRHAPQFVRTAFDAIPDNATVRLYVDGDFDSITTVEFWMESLKARPDLKVYGYSKSWDLLVEYDSKQGMPQNYVLNLSSGGAHQKTTKDEMLAMPFVRGLFVGVPTVGKHPRGFARYDEVDYHREVRRVALEMYPSGRKVLSCPGKCGECCRAASGGPQACGDLSLKGVVIANGLH